MIRILVCLSSLILLTGGSSVQAGEFDWPFWRGPQQNGISTEKNLPDEWNPEGGEGSNLVWKREDLGTRSTPIVMNGKLYTLCRDKPGTKEEAEKVVCLNAATGETLWESRYGVYLSDVPAERVAWSSVVADPETGHVFALGVCGLFKCLDGETGDELWSRSLHEEYGLLSTFGGRTNFPVVHENHVIISSVVIGWGDMAKPAHRFIAFDKRNGQPVWFNGTRLLPEDTTYSAPVLTTFNGEAAMVFASGDGGVHAFQPRTGKPLWFYNVSGRGINTTPLVVGDRVFCGHSEENLDDTKMGALFAIDGTQSGDITTRGEIWRTKELFVGKSAPLLINDRLYAVDDRAKLHIVNPETGESIAEQRLGTQMRNSPIYADGKIYTCSLNGRWYILKPTDEGVEVVHQLRLDGECDASFAVSAGRIYVPLSSALYCIGKPDVEPARDPVEPAAVEAPVEDTTPAQLQIVPVEVLLRPGEQQPFHIRMYNAKGQWVRNAQFDIDNVQFEVDGPGYFDNVRGIYSIPASHREHSAVTIKASANGATGTARIRVVPPLDWSFDFDSGKVPITWIGARYRHIAIDYDLYTKLKQENPLAARMYIYLTTDFTNFARSESVYDDSTPARQWSALLGFLQMRDEGEKPKTVDEARQKLGLALQHLTAEKVLSDVEWTTWERDLDGKKFTEPRLKVTRGERTVDGNGVMVKISTIPKGARSRGWMGPRRPERVYDPGRRAGNDD